MIKAIIFDYDGVIIDSFPSVFEVYKGICKHFKVSCPATIDEFRTIYGYNYAECLKNLGIQEKDYAEANLIYEKEIVKMEHGTFADISNVIEKLAKKYKVYLVSASHSAEILPKIEKFGLTGLFEKIYCGADQKIRKSDMINALLKEYNYSLSEVISIGDRVIDYDAAKKVGIDDDHVILVDYGWGLDKSKIGKAKIASNPKEVLKLISKAQ